MKKQIIVISDVDGCLTNGSFIYTSDGKVAKTFGANDNEGVKLLKKNDVTVTFISADTLGEEITRKRISDMNCSLAIVKESNRSEYLKHFSSDNIYKYVIFFGDGIGDANVANKIDDESFKFVCPANARNKAKKVADYVCEHSGGDGAFLDLAYYICENLLDDYVELYQ